MCRTFIAQMCYESKTSLRRCGSANRKSRINNSQKRMQTSQIPYYWLRYLLRPVVTRWRSWLNTALHYAKNLPEVTAIMETFKGFGILVTQAKVSLRTTGLATQLLKIKYQYECLVKLIETIESTKCTINETVQAIHGLYFGEDTCTISRYIQKRSNHISKINEH